MFFFNEKRPFQGFIHRVRSMRLHIGLLLGFPYLIYGLLVSLALSNWNWMIVQNSLPKIMCASLIGLIFPPIIFVINDYYDMNYDALDPQKKVRNIFCQKENDMNKLFLGLIVLGSYILCIILSYIINFEIVIIGLTLGILAYFYSAQPIRLKEAPIIDFLLHGVCFGGYFFLLGGSAIVSLEMLFNEKLFLLLFLLCCVDASWIQYNSQLVDIDIDRKTGQKTTCNRLSTKWSIWILKIIIVTILLFLPSYLLLNVSLLTMVSPVLVRLTVFFSFILVFVYLYTTHGGQISNEEIRVVSSNFRNCFIYLFSIISIILI